MSASAIGATENFEGVNMAAPRMSFKFLAVIAGALIFAPVARAEVRALLVGVSHYSSPVIPDLEGPANDLQAMEVLARKVGATDVSILRDGAVTRSTVEDALYAIGQRARPGDWILVYYSGHGSQAEARVKGTRDGDFDQFLPLAGFDPDNQDPERFIVDKDIYDWLSRYVRRDVQILMLADTCHSGTLHRSVDRRSYRFTPRLALRAGATNLQLVSRPGPKFPSLLEYQTGSANPGAANTEREDLPNLIYLAAAQDDELAQELAMPDEDGPSRGLLTYAFEQGILLTGPDAKTLLADLDGDGSVTTAEIASYIASQVRGITGERQRPKASYVTGMESLKLFATADLALRVPDVASRPSVYVADASGRAAPLPESAFWRKARTADQADFVWDLPTAEVVRRSGDVVAEAVDTTAKLEGVLEKWRAIDALLPMANESRGSVEVAPLRAGSRFVSGMVVKVSLQTLGSLADPAFATVFNVAADGTVQLIFPTALEDGKGELSPRNNLPLIETQVIAPFGVDHVVALLTRNEPHDFRALLQSFDGQRGFGKMVAPIIKLLGADAGGNSLALAQIYTAKTGVE